MVEQINNGEMSKKENEKEEPEGVQVDFIGLILDGKVYTDETMERDQASFWEDYLKCNPATLEKLITGFLGMAGMENMIEDTLKMYEEKANDRQS